MPKVKSPVAVKICDMLREYKDGSLPPHRRKRLLEQIVAENVGLVRRLVDDRAKVSPNERDDLESKAFAGLLNAIEGFDPSTGFAFSSFAVRHIQGEMGRLQREPDPHTGFKRSQSILNDYQRAKKTHRQWCAIGLSGYTVKDAAISIGITEERWQRIQQECVRQNPRALDDEDETLQLEAQRGLDLGAIREALLRLPVEQMAVASMHWGDGLAIDAIAKALHQTPDDVAQMITAAKEHLLNDPAIANL